MLLRDMDSELQFLLNFKQKIGAGIIITIIGAWLKCLIMEGFWIVVLGQVIISMAQPLIGNGITQVSNTWFAPAEVVYECN